MSRNNYHDCHCHLLPCLDDGPKDISESVEMARVLSNKGFTSIVCTPHLVKGTFESDVGKIRETVTALQESLAKNNINLDLIPSVEHRLDEHLLTLLDDPLPIAKNIVLVELPRHIRPETLLDIAYTIIVGKKLNPMIAHPERHEIFVTTPDKGVLRSFIDSLTYRFRLSQVHRRNGPKREDHPGETLMDRLHDMGCLFQGNIGSFVGIYGEHVRKRAIWMLKKGLYDRIGTDAHGPNGLMKWLEKGMGIIQQETAEEGLAALLRPIGDEPQTRISRKDPIRNY